MEQVDVLDKSLEKAWRGDAPRLILDLAGCPHVDTGGIAVLVTALKRARESGRVLFLVAPSPQVQSVLQMMRLDRAFDICPTVDAALFG